MKLLPIPKEKYEDYKLDLMFVYYSKYSSTYENSKIQKKIKYIDR